MAWPMSNSSAWKKKKDFFAFLLFAMTGGI